MRDEFIEAMAENQAAFGFDLPGETVSSLADYYEIVFEHNPLLHLVAPCPPEEFAVRHVLESLTLLKHLPRRSRFADIGTGAGLPSVPCLLARDDLAAILIESKEKKSVYLENAVERLKLSDRVTVVNRQFEEAEPGGSGYVVCRALDKFSEKLPRIVKWSGGRKMLFFGGPGLREALEKRKFRFKAELMPLSEQRFLFAIEN